MRVFIVFEGGEGAGKTTQVRTLADRLSSVGRTVTTTREPGGTPTGERIRSLLLDNDPDTPMPPQVETLLFLADRSVHVNQVIRPALERGDDVICDRYVDSTVAYQGFGRGLGEDRMVDMSRWAAGRLDPDLVFILDVDPKVGLERAGRAGTTDRMEGEALAFHGRVRVAFLRIAEERTRDTTTRTRYHILSTTLRTADEIAAEVSSCVQVTLLDTARAGGR